jgi:hypothetical protein
MQADGLGNCKSEVLALSDPASQFYIQGNPINNIVLLDCVASTTMLSVGWIFQ